MIRLSLLTIALFSSMSVNAAYVLRMPMEQNLGGHLQNNSIVFLGNNSAEPKQPEKPVEDTSITINSTYQKVNDYTETFSIGLYANAGDAKPFASQLASKNGNALNNQFTVNVQDIETLLSAKTITVNGVTCNVDIRRDPGAGISRSVGCSNIVAITASNVGSSLSVKINK
ncbi:hypothetical protein ACI77J_01200 [Pseudomonas sp. O64]|uniref:hypothetical protein n=1 Tax=unclassified Pseudomonas TaxID=196821 RepID=UPI00387AAA65